MVLVWLLSVILVMILLLGISVTVSQIIDPEFDQNEPFECGFVHASKMHVPFCIHFYMVGLLFLVFDMELVVSIPLIMMNMCFMQWVVVWFVYSLILTMGMMMEIVIGSLDWDK